MPHNQLGATGKAHVAHVFRSVGLNVQFRDPADLLVDGIPIEVKAVRPAPYHSNRLYLAKKTPNLATRLNEQSDSFF
jgi:hypothetical protein